MKVISVNVSAAVKVEYDGETVSTGIFKKPLSNSVNVSSVGLTGDEQADLINHGGAYKAVYAFSSDHYEHWRQVLEKPSLPLGAFGENLSISNLDESKMCIGDQLRVGTCLLEVSQPRVPCFKLGIALGNTRAPKLFTKTFRTGVYFRVLEEGALAQGDEVVKTFSAPGSVSVETLFQAYFDKSYEGAEAVFLQALKLDSLAPEWKEKLVKRV